VATASSVPRVADRAVSRVADGSVVLGPLESSELSRRSTRRGTAGGGGSAWMRPEFWDPPLHRHR
jgi:hypothetical protein